MLIAWHGMWLTLSFRCPLMIDHTFQHHVTTSPTTDHAHTPGRRALSRCMMGLALALWMCDRE